MQFTFVTWDGGGNVGPAVALADALRARGHACIFLGYRTQRRRLEARGFELRELARSGGYDLGAAPPPERFAATVRHVWACPEHLDDIPEAAEGVWVLDFLMHGAL